MARQYWVLDSEETEERKEDWISKLLSMDDVEDPVATPRKKKGKTSKTKKAAPKAKAKVGSGHYYKWDPSMNSVCQAAASKTAAANTVNLSEEDNNKIKDAQKACWDSLFSAVHV